MSSENNGSFYAALLEDLRLVEVWRYRWSVLFLGMIGFLLGVIYLHMTPVKYTATLEVTTLPDQAQSNSLSSRIDSSALASLAGLNTASNAPNFELYLEAIYSREVANQLSHNQSLMREVFPDQWDNAAGKWRKNPDPLGPVKGAIRWFLGIPPKNYYPPGGPEIEQFIDENVQLHQMKNKQIVTITIQHKNRRLAVDLLTAIDAATDGIVKKIALERSTKYSEYLTNALQRTTVEDVRQALIATLVEQEKNRMVASSNLSYAAQRIGQAYMSPRPTSPKPTSAFMGGFSLAAFLGCLAAMFQLSGIQRLDNWLGARWAILRNIAVGVRGRVRKMKSKTSEVSTRSE